MFCCDKVVHGLNKHSIFYFVRVRLNILSVYFHCTSIPKLCFKAFNFSNGFGLIFTGGFYTQLFESNSSSQPLRIISLNTNLYYSPNSVTVNITDPADQFAWLEEILETSSQKKEKVGAVNRAHQHYLFKL